MIIYNEQLKKAFGVTRNADVEAKLVEENIRYFYGKKGPWTTVGLLEAAKGLVNGQMQKEDHQELL